MAARTALLAAGFLAFGALAPVAAQEAPKFDVIETRQAGQDLIQAVADAMKGAVAANADPKPYAKGAKAVARWALQFQTLFPPGSETGHDTKAKPAIWSDRAGFEQAAMNLNAAALKLAAAAQSGDQAAFASGFAAMGDTCGACHKKFKNR